MKKTVIVAACAIFAGSLSLVADARSPSGAWTCHFSKKGDSVGELQWNSGCVGALGLNNPTRATVLEAISGSCLTHLNGHIVDPTNPRDKRVWYDYICMNLAPGPGDEPVDADGVCYWVGDNGGQTDWDRRNANGHGDCSSVPDPIDDLPEESDYPRR